MSDRKRRARLHDIAQIAGALREPVETPDLTSSILERVHAAKPFAPAETRRWVPIVRIGIAGMLVTTVMVFTLIVFLNPRLPEDLGAAPSLTTEFVASAEEGLSTRLAELRAGVTKLSEQADLKAHIQRASLSPTASNPIQQEQELMIAAAARPVIDARPAAVEPGAGTLVTFLLPAPVPTPIAVEIPSIAAASGEPFDAASFVESFPEIRMMREAAGATTTGRPWHRAMRASQAWSVPGAAAATSGAVMPVGFVRERVNHRSPLLVKELFPVITGQPAGDELQIR